MATRCAYRTNVVYHGLCGVPASSPQAFSYFFPSCGFQNAIFSTSRSVYNYNIDINVYMILYIVGILEAACACTSLCKQCVVVLIDTLVLFQFPFWPLTHTPCSYSIHKCMFPPMSMALTTVLEYRNRVQFHQGTFNSNLITNEKVRRL